MRALGGLAALTLLAVCCYAPPAALALAGPRGDLAECWARAFHDSEGARTLFLRSLTVALSAAATAAALGTLFALAAHATGPRRRRGLAIAALTPAVLPPYLTALGLGAAMGPRGALGTALEALFGATAPLAVLSSPLTCGAILGAGWLPLVALPALSLLDHARREEFEAALLARGRPGVLKIAFAAVRPALPAGLCATFALALCEVATPDALSIPVYAQRISLLFDSHRDATAAALAALPLAAASTLLLGAALALLPANAVPLRNPDPHRGPLLPLGRAGRTFAALAAAACLLPGLVLPALLLLWYTAAGPGSRGLGDQLAGALALARSDTQETLFAALGAAAVAAGAGALLGWATVRLRGPRRTAVLALAALPLAWPPPVIGIGLVLLWNQTATAAIYDSRLMCVLAALGRFLPIGLLLGVLAWARIPPALLDAARLTGRSLAARTLVVEAALARAPVAAAFALVFALAAGEAGATFIAAPPGRSTLAPAIIGQLHFGRTAEVASLGSILIGCVAAPGIAALALSRAARVLRRIRGHERPP